jgi:hypothetical protein
MLVIWSISASNLKLFLAVMNWKCLKEQQHFSATGFWGYVAIVDRYIPKVLVKSHSKIINAFESFPFSFASYYDLLSFDHDRIKIQKSWINECWKLQKARMNFLQYFPQKGNSKIYFRRNFV